ncbi:MAG: 1,4-alpha-glucan branching protein GlgB [Planctomycetes bacterium]|nr:1,4-alpha-glucan branching protein GlgB [Planctomycetota bacterium]
MAERTAARRALAQEAQRLARGLHHDPHGVLGAHPGDGGVVVRAFHPDARTVELLRAGAAPLAMTPCGSGLFEARVAGARLPLEYRLRFGFAGGGAWERDDPYRFTPVPGELDLHLVNEGKHFELWHVLGARELEHQGARGVAFAVWAPNAAGVSVVGDFCGWDERLLPLRSLGASGVWELFVPGLASGARYKLVVRDRAGRAHWKADPLARYAESAPGTASRVFTSTFAWSDAAWLRARAAADPARAPLAVYEVHLGSWTRGWRNERPSYRELAPRLVAHAKGLGFTHLELLPVAEHPFEGSWGYQVSGYYAPCARFGDPDDLRALVDACHAEGLGVILDWVPAHFPRDEFALARFDGTPLYEHADPRRGEHPDWGTLIFDYGRNEVRNFLVANALYWLEEFHVDGLRVDAVASMLYLDYSRPEGQWSPNAYGGRENLDAVAFLRELNHLVAERHPGALMIAEESTAWPGVTRSVHDGGLGFTFKWNMGWMHDTLRFFARDPVHRGFHLDELTFAMLYEYSERYLMPLSHDEVVHGKGALLAKLPGDDWQRLATLRLLYAYQWLRPGKKLLFMGSELAPEREWDHDRGLEWHLRDDPRRAGVESFVAELGRLYRDTPALWARDHEPGGFRWITCDDRAALVIAFERWDDARPVVVALNLTPVPREGYRLGVPLAGAWRVLLASDDERFGGSGYAAAPELASEPQPWHDRAQSVVVTLPPLAAVVLGPVAG